MAGAQENDSEKSAAGWAAARELQEQATAATDEARAAREFADACKAAAAQSSQSLSKVIDIVQKCRTVGRKNH